MTTDDDAARIHALLEDQAKVIRAKDADAALASYAPKVVKFDLAPPLATTGSRALSKPELQAWFATSDGPIGFDLRDFSISVSDDLAFCHGFVRISGTKTSGERNEVWARATTCLRRIDGTWRIVHEHTSVPFYMDGSLRAAVDLRP
jgi:PhnB protein